MIRLAVEREGGSTTTTRGNGSTERFNDQRPLPLRLRGRHPALADSTAPARFPLCAVAAVARADSWFGRAGGSCHAATASRQYVWASTASLLTYRPVAPRRRLSFLLNRGEMMNQAQIANQTRRALSPSTEEPTIAGSGIDSFYERGCQAKTFSTLMRPRAAPAPGPLLLRGEDWRTNQRGLAWFIFLLTENRQSARRVTGYADS